MNESGEERMIMVEMKEMKNNFNPPLLSTVLSAKRISLNLLCHSRKIKGIVSARPLESSICDFEDIRRQIM